jgi:hypothetical protein
MQTPVSETPEYLDGGGPPATKFFSLRSNFKESNKLLQLHVDVRHRLTYQWAATVTQFRRVTPSIDVGSIVDDVMQSIGHVRRK